MLLLLLFIYYDDPEVNRKSQREEVENLKLKLK